MSASLYLKNTTVVLLMTVPWMLAALSQSAQNRSEARKSDQPPIIRLTEADGFRFDAGSAELGDDFKVALRRIVAPQIRRLSQRYDCDVVEIVGHTDGQVMRGRSNVDLALQDDTSSVHELRAGSNADLGLMRAWAVLTFLQNDTTLRGLQLNALSASYLIEPNGETADVTDHSDVPERRRIEIRLRRRVGIVGATGVR